MYAYMCVCMYTYVMYTNTCVCTYMYIYIYIHIHIHAVITQGFDQHQLDVSYIIRGKSMPTAPGDMANLDTRSLDFRKGIVPKHMSVLQKELMPCGPPAPGETRPNLDTEGLDLRG